GANRRRLGSLHRWPSGEWQQTVNLPLLASYGGSNPPLCTRYPSFRVKRASEAFGHCVGRLCRPRSACVEHTAGSKDSTGDVRNPGSVRGKEHCAPERRDAPERPEEISKRAFRAARLTGILCESFSFRMHH